MTDYASLLDTLHEAGFFSHLDYYFARDMGRIFPGASALTRISAALVSKALADGHICLDLTRAQDTCLIPEPEMGNGGRLPDLDTWIDDLASSPMVGVASLYFKNSPGQGAGPDLEWVRSFPLVLDPDNYLYLAKYYDFQHRLAWNIKTRITVAQQAAGNHWTAMDPDFIRQGMARFFSGGDQSGTAGQKAAVEKALSTNFAVISGGPGTGKTHITRIIRTLMDEWAKQRGLPAPRVVCVAPTGKAAARLDGGSTIHSRLMPKPKGTGFVHNRDNPLAADMVIVDEASMIDMALMTRLVEAVPVDAKLVLLGDKNQLSPVQAGAAFTDICTVDGLSGHAAFLNFNFRSRGKTGIENLAAAVNDNDHGAVARILTGGGHPDIEFEDTGDLSRVRRLLENYLARGYAPLMSARTPEQAQAGMDGFRVLCAHNRGDSGTLQINHLCEKVLPPLGEGDIKDGFFKQIVMVSRNDYDKGLFNGDTGVVWDTGRERRVFFASHDGKNRVFRHPDLPDHEPAFAVTIHKSQGSEFDTVLILIPERISPVVTRQLLYTGITRARKKAVILGRLDNIRAAMDMPLERRSNLGGHLALCPG